MVMRYPAPGVPETNGFARIICYEISVAFKKSDAVMIFIIRRGIIIGRDYVSPDDVIVKIHPSDNSVAMILY